MRVFLQLVKENFYFFIAIPLMYRIDNARSEKILIYNLLICLQIEALGYKSCTLLSHDWGGALACMVRWPLHHNIIS